jgi:hypothetical protein
MQSSKSNKCNLKALTDLKGAQAMVAHLLLKLQLSQCSTISLCSTSQPKLRICNLDGSTHKEYWGELAG